MLVTKRHDEALHSEILKVLSHFWKNSSNLILGTEEFDPFGATPLTKRDGVGAIKTIVDLLQPVREDLEIVVMYRTPRQSQWLSIWRQITPGQTTYHNFICSLNVGKKGKARFSREVYYRAWEAMATAANPLGLVEELRSKNWNVVIIDMGGVEHDGMDISHTVACEILQVPCNNNGMVEGVLEQVRANQNKRRDPNITTEQKNEIEYILRQRDCAYSAQLQNDENVRILHRQSLWEDCSGAESYDDFKNTTFLLELLKESAQCNEDNSQSSNSKEMERQKEPRHASILSPHLGCGSDESEMLAATVSLQQFLLLALGLFLVRQVRLGPSRWIATRKSR